MLAESGDVVDVASRALVMSDGTVCFSAVGASLVVVGGSALWALSVSASQCSKLSLLIERLSILLVLVVRRVVCRGGRSRNSRNSGILYRHRRMD
jgi:hypothetical protein